jgi:hypothetical protein
MSTPRSPPRALPGVHDKATRRIRRSPPLQSVRIIANGVPNRYRLREGLGLGGPWNVDRGTSGPWGQSQSRCKNIISIINNKNQFHHALWEMARVGGSDPGSSCGRVTASRAKRGSETVIDVVQEVRCAAHNTAYRSWSIHWRQGWFTLSFEVRRRRFALRDWRSEIRSLLGVIRIRRSRSRKFRVVRY